MPSAEQMQNMGMTADQIQAAQAGGHTWEGGSNYGVNPATGGWEPNMGGGTTYGGGTTDWSTGGTSTAASEFTADRQANATTATQERTEFLGHDHNSDGISDHTHEIHTHTDNIRHDHTATSQADALPGAQYIP